MDGVSSTHRSARNPDDPAQEAVAPLPSSISDCGQDGCGECDVCRYLDFLEWCSQVASGGTIKRNPEIEKHMDTSYPNWRKVCQPNPPMPYTIVGSEEE